MVLSDQRPQKPRRFDAPGITAEVWNISEQCWHRRAADRPKVKDVLQDLEGVASSGKHAREACPCSLWEFIFYNRNRWRTALVGAKVTHIQMTTIYAGDQHFHSRPDCRLMCGVRELCDQGSYDRTDLVHYDPPGPELAPL